MSEKTILVSVSGPVALVRLNRPSSYNAFNSAMRNDLANALLDLEHNNAIRVVVLHGAGKGFSAGVDLKEGSDKVSEEVLETEFRPFLECIWKSQKLYIAAVHGHAAGIAAALAMACDFVVFEETAMLTLSFSGIGLIPDGGLVWHLTRALGPRLALEAIVEGQRLDANFCSSHELVNKVVPTGSVVETAETWAAQLANSAPLAASAAKRLVAASTSLNLGETFSAEARAQTALVNSNDHMRGVEAFFHGTTPEFSGD